MFIYGRLIEECQRLDSLKMVEFKKSCTEFLADMLQTQKKVWVFFLSIRCLLVGVPIKVMHELGPNTRQCRLFSDFCHPQRK
jgi:hypothetical protein